MNFIRANFRHYCIQQFYPEKNANEWFSHAALNSSNACFEIRRYCWVRSLRIHSRIYGGQFVIFALPVSKLARNLTAS